MGGIPIVSEIWDGIRWIIDFFVNKSPKPIKFLIFLIFLLLFSSILSFAFHIFGIHCNSKYEVVKVSPLHLSSNMRIVYEKSKRTFTEPNLTICDVYPDKCGNEDECYIFARYVIPENCSGFGGYYEACNESNGANTTGCKYFLKDPYCYNCNSTSICMIDSMTFITSCFGICGEYQDVCGSNASAKTGSVVGEYLTRCNNKCDPPPHYIWDIDKGIYVCNDTSFCGSNATAPPDYYVDYLLQKAGAEKLYTSKRNDYKSFVGFKCDKEFNPYLAVFGVPIFNYKIWLLVIVVYIMLLFLTFLNNHIYRRS